MARSFTASQAMYRGGNSPATAFPISMWCVSEHNSLASAACAMAWCRYNGYGSVSLYFRGDLGGDPIAGRRIKQAGTGDNNPQSAAYSTGTIYRVGLVCAANNDARLYVNGTKTTTSASIDYPTDNPDTVVCSGLWEGPTAGNDVTRVGLGQSFAFWDAALTDAEMASLEAGFSPRRIRPQNLKFYWPALRSKGEWVAGVQLDILGTEPSVTDHQRTYGM